MRALYLLACLTACYNPTLLDGTKCSASGLCPSGLVCDRGVCVREAGDGGLPFDAACGACSADGTEFIPCAGPPVPCTMGCTTAGGDHCAWLVPANGVDPTLTTGTTAVVLSGGITTFDTGSGAIIGAITRAAGTGVASGIGYYQVSPGLGVFAMGSLLVLGNAEVRFTGARAVVFLAEGPIQVSGRIDLSAGCYGADRSCPGPGGAAGATLGMPASGGGAGANGASVANEDGGGGGGGGGEAGGGAGSSPTASGGAAGAACLSPTGVPLRGGGGGGAGGPGTVTFAPGGGGGGGIQMTSQTAISITGTILSAGAGGGGGSTTGGTNAGAGSGGGGGGAILLEAPSVVAGPAAMIAANGGGGGGGGNVNIGPGTSGADGSATRTPATGGTGTADGGSGSGGNGGAGTSAPAAGSAGVNAGGGGGARGVIRVRATSPSLAGTSSPTATTGPIETR
ncbi:MAG TPA: hypothetical protein VNO30_16425 [Kofleriaceae bacterium]|nr:hypothetical protein [Kofleriaceae bacterium]